MDTSAWIAPGAMVLGDVTLGERASVWYSSVIRADQEAIRVGAETNIQDGSVLHADPGFPLIVGDRVSVGHGAVLHGCRIADDVLVGMRATILNGAEIGTNSLVAAGAVVLGGTVVPPRSLVAGVPAKVRRELTDDEVQGIKYNSAHYLDLAARHAAGEFPAA